MSKKKTKPQVGHRASSKPLRNLYSIRLTDAEKTDLERAAALVSTGHFGFPGPRTLAARLIADGVKEILKRAVDAVTTT